MTSTSGQVQQRPGIAEPASQQIRVARVLCIVLLVYVHTPPFFQGVGQVPHAVGPFDWLRAVLSEGLSRSSVPLLSVISGYLLVASETARSYGHQIARKAQALLLPLLLWNVVAAVVHSSLGNLPPADLLGWANRLIALSGVPLITPLYFLRDVFIMIALYPLMAWALRRASSTPEVALLLALLLASRLAGFTSYLFLNASIPMFFVAGMAFGSGRLANLRLPPTWFVVGFFLAAAAASTADFIAVLADPAAALPRTLDRLLVFAQRFSGAMLFWWLSGLLVQSRLMPAIRRIEPYIFFHFCAHTLVLGIAWRVLSALGMQSGTGQVVFFLTAPAWTLAASLAGAALLAYWAPAVLKVLLGGRLPARSGLRPAVAPARS